MLWTILAVAIGLWLLDGFRRGPLPAHDVTLPSGRRVRVLEAKTAPEWPFDRESDPWYSHGPVFGVVFAADGLSSPERLAAIAELADWAAAAPEARECGRVNVRAGERVIARRLYRRVYYAEWAEFRRTPAGGLERLGGWDLPDASNPA